MAQGLNITIDFHSLTTRVCDHDMEKKLPNLGIPNPFSFGNFWKINKWDEAFTPTHSLLNKCLCDYAGGSYQSLLRGSALR